MFLLAFEKIVIYILFFTAGFFIFETKTVGPKASGTLSQIVMNVFLPLMVFDSVAQNCTIANIHLYGILFACGFVLLLIGHFTGELIARILGGNYLERITNVYTTVIPNYGFMGYPMILALFGNEMLSRFAVMVLPITIYSFMIGMPKFNPADATTFSERFRKAMNLTLAANLVGIVYGLSGLPYPSLIQEICRMGADCIGPMTMVITGITIGRVGLKDSFRNGRAAVMSGIRSVVLPALLIFGTYLLCRETGLDKTVFICTAIYSVFPAPLNTIIFAENYGLDGSYGASCALISMLASIITVPLWLQIAVNLFETL